MGRHSKPGPDDEPIGPYDPHDDEAGADDFAERDALDEGAGDYGDHRHRGEESYPDEPPGYVVDGVTDDAQDYPDFPAPQRHSLTSPPPVGGGHRGGDEWRGGHRSSETGRRGVSVGVIAALVAVVVVVAAVILWRFFGDALSNRSHTAAARCVAGKETVAVIADPSIAAQVQKFAQKYNGSAGPVGDHCVVMSVKPADSDAVVNGFVGQWAPELGDRPALWIPGSSVSAARLSAAVGKQTISDSRSLVTSPVLLAVRPELQRALGNQNWAGLPGLQSTPDSLTGLKLPGWGPLRLAMPVKGNSDAAYLAAEAVAAGSAPPGAPATAGTGAVRTLLDGQPKLADDSVTEAMNALLRSGDPAKAPVHAVVTTEQQLFQRAKSTPEAALTSWLPAGPAAVADYPTVLLAGSWLVQDQVTAASAFARFLHKPDQLAELAKAGFRAQGVKPPKSDVTSFSPLSSTVSVGDDAMRATLADMLTAPAAGPAAIIMLDQSMTSDEGGKTRLANVLAALEDRIRALPPNAVLGLWTFDGKDGRSELPSGPLSDQVNGQLRTAALLAALDNQFSSNGGAVSFTTLRLVYQQALANYRAGQNNSILVITTGPHTDQTLDGAGLQDFIKASVDPNKRVAVNVIDFGDDPDRLTWEAVAHLSGGGYRNLPTSASPDLATAVNTFLS